MIISGLSQTQDVRAEGKRNVPNAGLSVRTSKRTFVRVKVLQQLLNRTGRRLGLRKWPTKLTHLSKSTRSSSSVRQFKELAAQSIV